MSVIRIALSKGRIFDETLPLFAAAGIVPEEDPASSRKLIIGSNRPEVQFLVVRATDVPTYVQHGGAELGVVGKDVLMEHGGQGVLEPIDLNIARCRLMVCGRPDTDLTLHRRWRVATKFVQCARAHFARHVRQVEIIKLYGSMELAPLTGLADLIVDVVDTGNTLRANGLVPLEHMADISARMIVNRAAMKTRHASVQPLLEAITAATDSCAAKQP